MNEQNAKGHFNHNAFFPETKPAFQDVTSQIGLNWKHKEDDFVDFNQQPLIPHMLSAEGPRVAVADVNHDGKPDLFIGGRFKPGMFPMAPSR